MYEYDILGQARERWSFRNAECGCRTCVDSNLEVRLPGRTSRPLMSARTEIGRRGSLLFSDILESYWRGPVVDRRVIKFNFELRKDAESTFSRNFAPITRRTYPEVVKHFTMPFFLVPLTIYIILREASLVIPLKILPD